MVDLTEPTHHEAPSGRYDEKTGDSLRLLSFAVTGLGAAALVAALVRNGGVRVLLDDGFFLIWGLLPFALAFFGLRKRGPGVARPVGVVVASGFGLAMYADLLLASRISSTGALAFIFIPLWQLVGCGTVLLLTVKRRRSEGAA